MRIEKATMEDAKEILALQYLVYQSEAEIYQDWTIPPLMQTLAELITEFKQNVILKAVDQENKIVGSIRAMQQQKHVEIGRLMVHPEAQRQGIGRQLLLAIETYFNATHFELFTGSKSSNNIRLYEKSGYRIYQTEKIHDGLTFVYMQKDVN